MLGERFVVGGGAGPDTGREAVEGAQPLLVQGVEPVESVAQHTQLVQPPSLHRLRRQLRELSFGRGQQMTCGGTDGLEGGGGVGVALPLTKAVGVVVVGPAVEVGVLVGVGVPGGQDGLGPSLVTDEEAQCLAVLGGSAGDEGNP
ncbi:hypothetical protein [Streptomyces sp. enrichment culture]|uniref:hypothetical protein n=1 Tax=Streptomyces sp. enrichment culture TaxID=1795815 RepID=UPI003F56014E